jgi:hypothetical protein
MRIPTTDLARHRGSQVRRLAVESHVGATRELRAERHGENLGAHMTCWFIGSVAGPGALWLLARISQATVGPTQPQRSSPVVEPRRTFAWSLVQPPTDGYPMHLVLLEVIHVVFEGVAQCS